MTNWAVDLSKVEAVYPWAGTEVILVSVALVLWLLWHFIQIRDENREYAEDVKRFGNQGDIKKAIDEYPV